MKKISLLCFLLILLAMVVGGCSENPEVPEEPTEMAPVEVTATSTPTDAASTDPVADDTDTSDDKESRVDLIAYVEEVDYCIECHSDQAMLTQTADPEVEVESENEGEG